MKDKYIELRYPRYIQFGTYQDGRVCISSYQKDNIATVTKEQAEGLINDRDKVVDMLCEMARRFDDVCPDEFEKFWYEVD